MELSAHLLPLFSFLIVLVRYSLAQQFSLNEVPQANNSLIFIDNIGEGTYALRCHTTRRPCCKWPVFGEWYFPDGTSVSNKLSGGDFYRNRDNDGGVMLNRRNNAQSPKGRFKCSIPDNQGVVTHISVVIYSASDYPEVLTHPQPQLNVDPGSNVSFSVVGEGSSVYHWYHNGAGIPDGVSRYVGSRESTMTILNVTQADEGLYSCVVGNNILSVLSDSAQLTLLPIPVIVTHPSDHLEVTPGSSITFSVDAEGLRFNFQWLRTDGGSLPSDPQRVVGADTSSLTLYLVEVGDMGVYVCEVYNGAGRVRSEEAMLTVSGLEQVESLLVIPYITSAKLMWTPPANSETALFYQLLYYPTVFPDHSHSINTSLTTYEVTRLIPRLQYQFQLRVFTAPGSGEWLMETVTLETRIPPVQNLSVTVTNGNSVSMSWDPITDLKGWNVSYYAMTYLAYVTNKPRPEATIQRRVDEGRTSETLDTSELVMREGVRHVVEVTAVLEIEGVEGIGEVRGEKAVRNISLVYEKMPFQVMFGPVPYCITWEKPKASSIEAALREAITDAMQTRCNCSFPHEHPISTGIFSCRTSEKVATYRGYVSSLNASVLLEYIQDWVYSNTTVVLDYYLADVYSSCPAQISTLDEPDCTV